MIQLNPREIFTIARGLPDHTDSTTYYVRAVVRNAKTDAVIETINLTDSGDHHRYTYNWQVPPDVSGLGTYITIAISVYSDSGYTTKTEAYGDQLDTYLIQERPNATTLNAILPGDAGPDINYKKIQQLLAAELKKGVRSETTEALLVGLKEEVVRANERSHKLMVTACEKIDAMCGSVDGMPTMAAALRSIANGVEQLTGRQETDISPIAGKLVEIANAIDALSPVRQELTDAMSDLRQSVDNFDEKVEAGCGENMRQAAEKIEEMTTKVKEFYSKDIDEVKDELKKLRKGFSITLTPNASGNES